MQRSGNFNENVKKSGEEEIKFKNITPNLQVLEIEIPSLSLFQSTSNVI